MSGQIPTDSQNNGHKHNTHKNKKLVDETAQIDEAQLCATKYIPRHSSLSTTTPFSSIASIAKIKQEKINPIKILQNKSIKKALIEEYEANPVPKKALRVIVNCAMHKAKQSQTHAHINMQHRYSELGSYRKEIPENYTIMPQILANSGFKQIAVNNWEKDADNIIEQPKSMKAMMPLHTNKITITSPELEHMDSLSYIPNKFQMLKGEKVSRKKLFIHERYSSVQPLTHTNLLFNTQIQMNNNDLREIRKNRALLKGICTNTMRFDGFHQNTAKCSTKCKKEQKSIAKDMYITTMVTHFTKIGDIKKLLLQSIKSPEAIRNGMIYCSTQYKSVN